ncbi:DNA-binding response regulator [Escherichia coli]|uniref:DNA-binding response regulator n=1 Tax=Escherichia coli TaxID=562 RepID=A0A8S0FP45_ECOLX|nr:DNA-binding response regulator [Escherichia coli]
MNAIIIDDHPLAIAAIRNLLIKNDIEILAELTEGGSAVQRVETLKPDIVIIDVDIPGVNGIQVLETLRKRQIIIPLQLFLILPSYSGIIIIVSAKNDHFYGKHCADAGANGFVSKKEGMNNIIAAIEAAKNGYCYFPFSLNRFVGSLTSDQQKLDSLSKQEISVMRYILDGKDNNDIAEKMFISNKTVSTYKSRLMEKLECKSLMDLYTFAQRNKIG